MSSVGIDLQLEPLSETAAHLFCDKSELAWVRAPSVACVRRHRLTLLFSQKESVYKAWSALINRRPPGGLAAIHLDGSGRVRQPDLGVEWAIVRCSLPGRGVLTAVAIT